jgi:hypothetical protein
MPLCKKLDCDAKSEPLYFTTTQGHSSNQMAKIAIGTNNYSHEDQFPKMLS